MLVADGNHLLSDGDFTRLACRALPLEKESRRLQGFLLGHEFFQVPHVKSLDFYSRLWANKESAPARIRTGTEGVRVTQLCLLSYGRALVARAGFQPATTRLVIGCSVPLSDRTKIGAVISASGSRPFRLQSPPLTILLVSLIFLPST